MIIAVLIPTFFRPYGLSRVLRSVQDTAEFDNVIGTTVISIVSHEKDDNLIGLDSKYKCITVNCEEPRMGCSYAWNTALAAFPNADIYVLGADDLYFLYGVWTAVTKQVKAGYGMVGFNENNIHTLQVDKNTGYVVPNPDTISHYALTREFIVDHNGGVMAFPHYKAYKNDNETYERAKRVNMVVYDPDANIKHDWKGTASYSHSAEKDKRTFLQRKELGFPDDFSPIIGFKNG